MSSDISLTAAARQVLQLELSVTELAWFADRT
jgi:hypothetical protein